MGLNNVIPVLTASGSDLADFGSPGTLHLDGDKKYVVLKWTTNDTLAVGDAVAFDENFLAARTKSDSPLQTQRWGIVTSTSVVAGNSTTQYLYAQVGGMADNPGNITVYGGAAAGVADGDAVVIDLINADGQLSIDTVAAGERVAVYYGAVIAATATGAPTGLFLPE